MDQKRYLNLLSQLVSTSGPQFVCSNVTHNCFAPSSHHSHILCEECDQMPCSPHVLGAGRQEVQLFHETAQQLTENWNKLKSAPAVCTCLYV